MLRLRPLEVVRPTTAEEAVALLAAGDAWALSGGTDVLPNLKQGLGHPARLVSLRGVPDLDTVTRTDPGLRIGARARLSDLAASPDVRAMFPALADACGRVASPQVRTMATLGGNLCLEPRCRYVNQSELFRQALGGCLKSHGTECHVVPGGQSCVAALSADTVPVLVALDATAELLGPAGPRDLPVEDLYGPDGRRSVGLHPGELILAVRVPALAPGSRVAYRKWAVRRSIDFPLVSVAVRLDTVDDRLATGTAVAGVLGPRPRRVALNDLAGAPLDDALCGAIADRVWRRCKPLENVPYDAEYRRDRLRVEVARAVRELVGLGWPAESPA